jgi:membrane-anchored protein YejM (alkaline phosphatase superfamily)
MNTKLIMILSASFLGLTGIMLSFMPQEISWVFEIERFNPIIVQVLGAAYFGYAMLNWMARGNIIGGIYSRPVAIGNFMHFIMGALALAKYNTHTSGNIYSWIFTSVYGLFACLFGYIFFTNPQPVKK